MSVARTEPGTFVNALYVGVFTGSLGGLASALIATLRNNPRSRIYVVGTALNCFVLGTGFYVTRDIFSRKVFAYPQDQSIKEGEKVLVTVSSAAAVGGIWGAVIGGRRHAFPGVLVFGLAGLTGQSILNFLQKPRGSASPSQYKDGTVVDTREGIISRILNSENSPIRKLSTEEYISKMREKQLVLDAEIVLMDEEIERLSKKPRAKEESEGAE